MSESSVETGDYTATVPKAYIGLAWLWVAVPFGYGVYELILKVGQLFG
ncbi:MFS transporter small subunit [Mycobacterium sp. NPDC003449]